MPGPEPRVWQNGTVLGPSIAEALYAEEGRVVAIGPAEEVLRSVPTGAERVDLRGRCVIPGLIDAHLHVAASIRTRTSVDLSGARSIRAIRVALEEHLRAHPGPVLGGGWDQGVLEEARMPTRADLDRLPTDRPVVLFRRCGHVATLNTAALEAAGLDDATPDPPGGSFGRSGGALDGRLFDAALAPLAELEDRWYPLDPGEVREWLAEEASFGVSHIGVMSAEPGELRALRAATDGDPAVVRATAYLRNGHWGELASLRAELDSPALRIAGWKVMADGSLGARTAWLSEPYNDEPSTSGTPVVGPAELPRILRAASESGATTAVHAIGDRALRGVLDAVEEVPEHAPVRVEHASVAPPALIDRLAAARLGCAVQPSFVTSDRGVPGWLGTHRARWAYPFRTLLERGVVLGGSSDAPIESRDPWRGLAAATAPRSGASAPERLEPHEALSMYTRGGAALVGEAGGGTLAPGTSADLVVLGVRRWPEAIERGRPVVEATYLGGRRAFRRADGRTSQGL